MKKHGQFDDILDDLDTPAETVRGGARFFARQGRVGERLSGEIEEKTLRRIDPAQARMWDRHNRAYDLLTEDNCRDLIDGIRSQGQQEFPAIVRRTGDADVPYEVICGARRHFAVTWLRANNHPQIGYLVEIRDLTDEEAFRLSDIENRDRDDISDYERAVDYLKALDLYYRGSQKEMAARMEVSPTWLSRYLQLARLPQEIVAAFPSIHDLREVHARTLRPHLGRPKEEEALLSTAKEMAGQGISADEVMARLKGSVAAPKAKVPSGTVYRRTREESGIRATQKGRMIRLEFSCEMSREALRAAFEQFLTDRFKG